MWEEQTMFDPMETVKASRAVGLRELVRTARSLIDEIEMNGSVFVISKYGRMVAVLAPVPERTMVEFLGPGLGDGARVVERPIEARPEWAELDNLQCRILRTALGNHPMPWQRALLDDDNEDAPDARSLSIAQTCIELGGYMERSGSGWKLTREGLAAARWLDSTHASAPS